MNRLFKVIAILSLFFALGIRAAFAETPKAAVVSSHPLATLAAGRVLAAGGSAADAAIAASLVLAVVQPTHSGLGGGGLAIAYEKNQNAFSEFDYMESLSLDDVMGSLLPPPENVKPFKTGVPGLVAGLEKIHKRFGKLPWADLFVEAIQHAKDGFAVSEDMATLIALLPEETKADADFKTYFLAQAGEKAPILKQENLFRTLEKIRDGGAAEFYRGGLAKLIAKEVLAKGGSIHESDLQYYEARVGRPAEFYFKDMRLFVPNRPSFGGPFLDRLLRTYRVAKVASDGVGFLQYLETEAEKFLSDKPFLAKGAPIKTGYASFVAVVDGQGNAVALVNTLHGLFGSGVVLPGSGILMNAASAEPLMKETLSEADAMADYTLNKRPAHFLMPLFARRGFDDLFVFAGDGGFASPQAALQILVKIASEGVPYAKALKAPKVYALPQAKQNLFEKGYPAKALTPKAKNPASVSPFPLGQAGLVVTSQKGMQAFVDGRGESAARLVSISEKGK